MNEKARKVKSMVFETNWEATWEVPKILPISYNIWLNIKREDPHPSVTHATVTSTGIQYYSHLQAVSACPIYSSIFWSCRGMEMYRWWEVKVELWEVLSPFIDSHGCVVWEVSSKRGIDGWRTWNLFLHRAGYLHQEIANHRGTNVKHLGRFNCFHTSLPSDALCMGFDIPRTLLRHLQLQSRPLKSQHIMVVELLEQMLSLR